MEDVSNFPEVVLTSDDHVRAIYNTKAIESAIDDLKRVALRMFSQEHEPF